MTPFNSMQRGPKRDVIGELTAAVRKQGMAEIPTDMEITALLIRISDALAKSPGGIECS